MPVASVDLVSTNAVNLIQMSNMLNPGMTKEVVNSFIEDGNVYQDLPVITEETQITVGSRQLGLGIPVNWGLTNNPNQFVNSMPIPHQEQKYLILNGIMMNKYYQKDKRQFPGNSPM